MDFARLSRKLEGLEDASSKGYKVRDLHLVIRHPDIWYEAYANIYSNKGAMTKGIDDNTLDGMSKERISNLIDSIKEGTYEPQPVKRVYIPKKDGKLRPLGIPSGDDKLVQEVIRIMLERIYEPVFHDTSHGFRPAKSCHTALEQVQKTWTGVKWFVEFDIKGFFDNMSHEILIQLLEKKIDDKRFIKLINSFLKAGYLEDMKYNANYSGTPQGGIVSPILSNIYLHELDEYMADLCQEFDKGKKRPRNPEYRKLDNKLRSLREKLEKNGRNPELIRELKELKSQQKTIPYGDTHSGEFKRLKYCRYADDFIYGIIGTKHDAEAIMQTVKEFLRDSLRLETSPEKTCIQKAAKGIEFLSYGIQTQYKEKEIKAKHHYGRYTTRRTVTGGILLSVPQHKVMQFCKKYGYGNWQENKPLHRAELTNGSDLEIIETFNAELRGLANYYALAREVKADLSKLEYLSLYSLFKTLAAKHDSKLTLIIKRLKRGNEYIHRYRFKDDWKETKVFQLKHMTKPNGEVDELPSTLYLASPRSELIRRMEAEECEYCGRTDLPVEVHHVRKLKDLKSKPHLEMWQKVMIARHRKTLLLCAGTPDSCHRLLHQGKLPSKRHQPKNT